MAKQATRVTTSTQKGTARLAPKKPRGSVAHPQPQAAKQYFAPVLEAKPSGGNAPVAPLTPQFIFLHSLITKRLAAPLSVLMERDGDGYLAQTVDMPLYGSGETALDAVRSLQADIESLYFDLLEDDNFSDEWMARKKLLSALVLP